MIDTSYAVYDRTTKGYFDGIDEEDNSVLLTTLPSFYLDLGHAKKAVEYLSYLEDSDWIVVKVSVEDYYA